MKCLQLCILVTGPNTDLPSDTEIAKLQDNHLKFLESLWEKHTAVSVGPILNGRPIRGLVFMDAGSPEKARAILDQDPYIARGFLSARIFKWWCESDGWVRSPKFMDLQKYRFGLLSRTANVFNFTDQQNQANGEGHMANIQKMANDGLLVMAGPFEEAGKYRGIFIFKDASDETIRKATETDPLISQGILKLTLYDWMTSKASFKLDH